MGSRHGLAQERRQGFTILEILIAIVILVLGISGIVALFPTAIESGNQTVQDSYAAAITQSVVDAISVGIRESRYQVAENGGSGRHWNYFILDHDGVTDSMVASPQTYSPLVAEADWCILLPQGVDGNFDPSKEPVFNYPSVKAADGFGGQIDNRVQTNLANIPADPNADDWNVTQRRPNWKGAVDPYWFRKVYRLGRYRTGSVGAGTTPDNIREEFLGEPVGGGTASATNRPIVDPYPQYSFAIAMRRAKVDNCGATANTPPDGLIGQYDTFSSSLYEVRVFIFRNFDGSQQTQGAVQKGSPIPRTNVPIREFVTLMSL